MAKPPASPPSSDIDGVDEDEVRNTDAARRAGQGTGDLERARRDSAGHPTDSHLDRSGGRDDRTA